MIEVTAAFRRELSLEMRFSPMGRNNAYDVPLVQNDTGPRLRFNLVTEQGQPIIVSGVGTAVRLHLRRYGEEHNANDGHEACSEIDVANGAWAYTLQEGDVSGAGTYFGDLEITFDDGRRETAFEAVRFLVRGRGGYEP